MLQLSAGFELFIQFGGQPLHLFFEGLIVFVQVAQADIAARGQDVIMGADFVERGGFTEAGDVLLN